MKEIHHSRREEKKIERQNMRLQKKKANAERRARKQEENAQKKTNLTPREQTLLQKRRERTVTFLVRLVLTVLVYLGIVAFIGLSIFFSIWMTKESEGGTITTRVSASNEETEERLSVLSENGTSYLGISFLERYGQFIYSGDYAARTIQFTDSGDSAMFSVNSSFCKVNGVDVNLGYPVVLKNGELYLPVSFYQNYITGLTFEGKGSNIAITQNSPLGYKLKLPLTTNAIPEAAAGSLLEFATQKPVFKADLEAYERYMNPGETTEFLSLVNSTYGISETFRPNDLTGVADRNAAYPGGDYHAKLRMSASKSLDAMLQESRENGFSGLQATSGYRSYAEQRYRFNTLVDSLMSSSGMTQAAAEAEAIKNVQKPGYSEYQTGLCADVRFPGEPIDTFKDTDAAKWLKENCYKFGFILRYPEGKEESTGMESQSWHFRYVGRYHAIRITYLEMSLEEYVDFMGLTEEVTK